MAKDSDIAPRLTPVQIGALVAGNALEFYDFLVYSFFAISIGRTFFPSNHPESSLLLALATFGAGFLTRPVGSIVIGLIANRAGRKPAMMLAFALMGVSILGLACTPSYARIGIAAPLLAILWRLIQGFALGGEVGPATALLAEATTPQRRGLFCAFQISTQQIAITCVGIIGFCLSGTISSQALDSWGWRVALMAGIIVVPVGLIVRATLPETLHQPDSIAQAAPETVRTLSLWRLVALTFVILASTTVGTYVLNTLTTYAVATLKMPAQTGFAATLVRGAAGAAFALAAGGWSDRVGRRLPMIAATLLSTVLTLPLFMLIVATRSSAALLTTSALLGACVAIASAPIITVMAEALPARIRAGTTGMTYAFAISVFGGSTPFVVTWLTGITHNPLTPAWYLVVASAAGLIALLILPETAPLERTSRDQQ